MASNSIGKIFRLTTFGESHGERIGGIIDGIPSNVHIDINIIQEELNRRKPGQSSITTSRYEDDKLIINSGLFNNKTTGSPISFHIQNNNTKSSDYNYLSEKFRPNHSDYTYYKKYHNNDINGGGRSSARETANWIVAGAIAKQFLLKKNIESVAYVSQIGNIIVKSSNIDKSIIESNEIRCNDNDVSKKMIQLIEGIKKNGDTIGGKITCVIKNVPIGIGEPIFDKLSAQLAKAMMSINAAKGFEIGAGFESITKKGSDYNDQMYIENDNVKYSSNNSGGIQGGISNGNDIIFHVTFKPISTIFIEQNTVNKSNKNTTIINKGRHDVCVVPRAVPIIEALSNIIIFDNLLYYNAMRNEYWI